MEPLGTFEGRLGSPWGALGRPWGDQTTWQDTLRYLRVPFRSPMVRLPYKNLYENDVTEKTTSMHAKMRWAKCALAPIRFSFFIEKQAEGNPKKGGL